MEWVIVVWDKDLTQWTRHNLKTFNKIDEVESVVKNIAALSPDLSPISIHISVLSILDLLPPPQDNL